MALVNPHGGGALKPLLLQGEALKAELARAQALMHYSPEARVVQRIIEAQLLLGQTAAAEQTRQHFRQVYPQQHDAWLARRASAAAGQ